MRSAVWTVAVVSLLWAGTAEAALTFGVVSPGVKVKPTDAPDLNPKAALKAARNEFESFQVVVRSDAGPVTGVSVRLSKPLSGPGELPSSALTLYRVGYHKVSHPSNVEGAAGPWPDPLIPDVDTYFGEKRNAFPFDVPEGETRAVWIDVLVPADAKPGDYVGELEVSAGGGVVGAVPIELHVGSFALPSTSSLASAFGMGWADPCLAHTGQVSCTTSWDEDMGNGLRALYLRSSLEHRFGISSTDYQPPFDASAAYYEKYVMPYLDGTGESRLPGARLTAVEIDGEDDDVAGWVQYAKDKGFFDRLFYYPVDEPMNSGDWAKLVASASAAHAADPATRVIITSSILHANAAGAADSVDIFVPVINYVDDKAPADHAGNQRATYDAWEGAKANRTVWAYQSCMSHGCGNCGTTTDDGYFTGWPQYVIDSTAVQNRCFSWLAFAYELTGELYFDATYQLTTAWDDGGQCAFGGSGDGTLFYPGKPSVIGGTKDIPVESIRMKMIREGREDYEYLRMAAAKDAPGTKGIATSLFPSAHECAQPAEKVASARDALFAMLDEPDSGQGGGGGAGGAGGTDAGSAGGGAAGAGGTDAGTPPVSADAGAEDDGGCGCRTSAGAVMSSWWSVAGLSLLLRRRRCRGAGRKLPFSG